MIPEYVRGEVETFFHHKRYGFIRDETGDSVFFHFDDGRGFMINPDEEDVEFDYNDHIMQNPYPGDKVIIRKIMGSKGPRAFLWGYAHYYDSLKSQLRLQQSTRYVDEMLQKPETLWYAENVLDRGLKRQQLIDMEFAGREFWDASKSGIGNDMTSFVDVLSDGEVPIEHIDAVLTHGYRLTQDLYEAIKKGYSSRLSMKATRALSAELAIYRGMNLLNEIIEYLNV